MFGFDFAQPDIALVISTVGRNHARDSTKIGEFRDGISYVISPLGRNNRKKLLMKTSF